MENKSPFKLLDPYTIEDKDWFFGRDQEINRLYQLVAQSKIVLVYGPSGAGKTSLVQCGLAGCFKSTDWFEIYVRRRNNINRSLRSALKKHALTPLPAGSSIPEAVDSLFLDYLRPIYLVFDQFEELYILGTPEERKRFCKSLNQLIRQEEARSLSVKVIIIMREEYIAHLYDLEQYLPFIFDQRLRVELMSAKNVSKVIQGSCRKLGIQLRKPVTTTNAITQNLSDRRFGIQLSYLQIYLDKLYHLAINTSPEKKVTFSPELVKQLGAIGNILVSFMDENIAIIQQQLQTAYPGADAEALPLLLNQFASLEGTRKPLMRADIARSNLSEAQLEFCLARLVDFRIIRHYDRIFELSHDKLADSIAEGRDMLQKNLLKIQQLIEHKLEIYRERSGLLSENELVYIQPYTKYLQGNPELMKLIKASEQQLQKERDHLLELYREAESLRKEAEYKNRRAETLNRTLQSNIWLARKDFNRAIHFAMEAWKWSDRPLHPLAETKQALTNAFYQPEEDNQLSYTQEINLGSIVRNILLSPDESKLLVFTVDHKAFLYTIQGELIRDLSIKEIQTAAFSPDNHSLVLSTDSGTLFLLDGMGKKLRQCGGHHEPVRQIAFFPDGNTFLSAGKDFFGLWTREGKLLKQMLPHVNPAKPDNIKILRIAPDGSFFVSAAVNDHYVYIQPMQGQRFPLKRHRDKITALDISPDSQYIATVSADKHLIVWTREGDYKVDKVVHSQSITKVRFSPDSQKLMTASKDNSAKLWSLNGHNELVLTGHKEDVNQAFFSHDGQRIFTSSNDHTVRVWSRNGELQRILYGHQGRVSDAIALKDGKTLITASSDHTIKFWDLEQRRLIVLDQHTGPLNYASFSSDGKDLLTTSNDGAVMVWSRDGMLKKVLSHPASVDRAFFQRSGEKIFTLTREKLVYVWDRETAKLITRIGGKKLRIGRVASTHDAELLFTLTTDQKIVIWDGDFKKIKEFQTHQGKVYRFALCPNRPLLLTASKDHTGAIWHFSGELQARLVGHEGNVHSAFFSPGGDRVITASQDRTARVWDLEGNCLLELGGHPRSVSRAFFSPNETHILTQSMGYDIRLWDLEGNLLNVLDGHTGHVNRVSFSPCGRYILSTSNDKNTILWNAEGEQIKKFQTHSDIVSGGFFSRDSLQFVTVSNDGEAHLFFTPEGIFRELAG